MPSTVCEHCLSLKGELYVYTDGEQCSRCGKTPVRGALTPREIRACLGIAEVRK
jgi:hypothetical protein